MADKVEQLEIILNGIPASRATEIDRKVRLLLNHMEFTGVEDEFDSKINVSGVGNPEVLRVEIPEQFYHCRSFRSSYHGSVVDLTVTPNFVTERRDPLDRVTISTQGETTTFFVKPYNSLGS